MTKIRNIALRVPISLLCLIAHLSGYVVALTIGDKFVVFIICAMIGLACIMIGFRHDEENKQ